MNFVSIINRQYNNLLPAIGSIGFINVRYKYWADKIAKGDRLKRFGYRDNLFKRGFMPRLKDVPKLPIPDYRPKNSWSESRALFGQNDYIDILGNNRLHPVRVSYNVPVWLRGVSGNEMQLLIHKAKMLNRGPYKYEHPTAWNNINKRIRYLYCFLNRKKPAYFRRKQ